MSQCTDVDASLKRLEDKINTQNKTIADLKKKQEQCCQNNSKNLSNKDNTLEVRVQRLESYCNSIEQLFKDIQQTVKTIGSFFKGG